MSEISINQEIVEIARSFIGQEEVRGNLDFKDPKFKRLMEGTGWKSKEAWCVWFALACWFKVFVKYNSFFLTTIRPHVSASAVKFFNMSKNDITGLMSVKLLADPGTIAIWQTYKDGKGQWYGHAGIVSSGGHSSFKTVEGNTNEDGSREGYLVAEKRHTYDFKTKNGLRLLGFIQIPDIYTKA